MESEEQYTDQYIPSLLNEEPVVLMGLNETELMVSVGFGLFSGLAMTFLIGVLGNLGVFLLILFFFLTGVFSTIAIKWLRAQKSGKPRGYVGMKLKISLGRMFPKLINKSNLYIEDQPLCIGRSKRMLVQVVDGDE
ncbi:DUF3487 family protein (plasmid) [Alteromonas macleodii]|uniref:DUF3487 family protein n=1 Tax=Alteromonas macleodii TaxID=28108 RepID=UPI0030D07E10